MLNKPKKPQENETVTLRHLDFSDLLYMAPNLSYYTTQEETEPGKRSVANEPAPGPAPRSVGPSRPETYERIRKKNSPLGSADKASLSCFLLLCSGPCRELKISHMLSCTHLWVLTPERILPSALFSQRPAAFRETARPLTAGAPTPGHAAALIFIRVNLL